ncbi:MAG: hypothetical protein QXZ68_06535 [Candidatus Bathyarchaeia archaeon]
MPRQKIGGKIGISLHPWVPLDVLRQRKSSAERGDITKRCGCPASLRSGEADGAGEDANSHEFLKREFRKFERLRNL